MAKVFADVLGNEKASKQVFNISGEKYVTFDGLARACAKVVLADIRQWTKISINLTRISNLWFVILFCQAGGFPEPEIIHYNPKEFDFGKKKAFPFRDQVYMEKWIIWISFYYLFPEY